MMIVYIIIYNINHETLKTFIFKQGLAGALLLGTSAIAKAGLPDPVKPKAPKAVNPFHLGMAGYTFVNLI